MVDQPVELSLDKKDSPSRKEGITAVLSVVFSIFMILGVMAMLLVMSRIVLEAF